MSGPIPKNEFMGEMPFWDHMMELRVRLIRIVAVLAVGTLVFALFARDIDTIIMHPVQEAVASYNQTQETEQQIRLTRRPEGLASYMLYDLKLGFVTALIVTLPFSGFQLWLFILPALSKKERKTVRLIFWAGAFPFLFGLGLAYKVLVPFFTHAMLSFRPTQSAIDWSTDFNANQLLMDTLKLHGAIGIIFELPVVMLGLYATGLVTTGFMRRQWRVVYFASFILGALLTPPDVMSQMVIGGLMIVLFELGMLLCHGLDLMRRRKTA